MPQVIQHHTTPEQAHHVIEQAIVLLDEVELTPSERANLLPVVVTLLADKAVAVIPDAPPLPLLDAAVGRAVHR